MIDVLEKSILGYDLTPQVQKKARQKGISISMIEKCLMFGKRFDQKHFCYLYVYNNISVVVNILLGCIVTVKHQYKRIKKELKTH